MLPISVLPRAALHSPEAKTINTLKHLTQLPTPQLPRLSLSHTQNSQRFNNRALRDSISSSQYHHLSHIPPLCSRTSFGGPLKTQQQQHPREKLCGRLLSSLFFEVSMKSIASERLHAYCALYSEFRYLSLSLSLSHPQENHSKLTIARVESRPPPPRMTDARVYVVKNRSRSFDRRPIGFLCASEMHNACVGRGI